MLVFPEEPKKRVIEQFDIIVPAVFSYSASICEGAWTMMEQNIPTLLNKVIFISNSGIFPVFANSSRSIQTLCGKVCPKSLYSLLALLVSTVKSWEYIKETRKLNTFVSGGVITKSADGRSPILSSSILSVFVMIRIDLCANTPKHFDAVDNIDPSSSPRAVIL